MRSSAAPGATPNWLDPTANRNRKTSQQSAASMVAMMRSWPMRAPIGCRPGFLQPRTPGSPVSQWQRCAHDLIQAHMWFNLAATQRSEQPKSEAVANDMTASRLRDAQKWPATGDRATAALLPKRAGGQ